MTGPDDGPHSRLARLTPATVGGIAVLLSVAARSMSGRLSDPDLWWHLRTGAIITSERAIPGGDPFSFVAGGRPWVVQEWGSEVILHGIDAAFGLRGLIVWRSVMLLAIYGVLAAMMVRAAGDRLATWGLLALAAYAGAASWTERPNLLSFFLLAVTLWLWTRRDRAIWWFVPVAAVWANLHGMVVLGLGLVFLLFATESLKSALRWEGADPRWARRLGFVFVAGLLASFANPYGPGLHAHAFRLVRIVRDVVTEWASPDFTEPTPLLFLALALVTLAALALGPRRPDPTDTALALAFVALGLFAVRNLPASGIVLGLVAARHVPQAWDHALATRLRRPPPRRPGGAAPLAVAVLLVAAVFGVVVASDFPRSGRLEAVAADSYPVRTLRSLPAEGDVRLLTLDRWAGLALYMGWPDTTVAFDTRVDFYGRPILDLYRDLITATGPWRERLRDLCVTHVLLEERAALSAALDASGEGWARVAEQAVEAPGGGSLRRAVLFRATRARPGCPAPA